MKIKTTIAATILMVAASVSGQPKHSGINLSLWKGVATQRMDSTQSTWFNLGLLSEMNAMSGVSVNVLSGITRQNMNGVQLSGAANVIGRNSNGILLAGLSNVVGDGMHGVQISGITNVNGSSMNGVSLSGLVNITADESDGVMIAGLTNIAGSQSNMVAIAGIMNILSGDANGVQLSGLCNLVTGSNNGLALSGLLNITAETHNGLQLSALGNIAGNQLNGAQIGLMNIGTNVRGLQLGLFNYYRESFKGAQIGLINANPDTRIQMMVYGGNKSKINVGARFRNERFYTILTAGGYYFDFKDKFSATLGYRAGVWQEIFKNASISADLGYEHIQAFKNRSEGVPPNLYQLAARFNAEYAISRKFAIFATGGYGISRHYRRNATYDKGAIIEAGILLF